jgi:hypothetical protein
MQVKLAARRRAEWAVSDQVVRPLGGEHPLGALP